MNNAWERQNLQILNAASLFWIRKESLLDGIHPNIGRRALSETLSEMVKRGTVRKLDRHSAPPFYRITDAGRARIEQMKEPQT